MSTGYSAPQLDVDALTVDVSEFLATVPVAEGVGAKLSRLLHGFLAVVSDVLRLYAEALECP
jgi:hypothetical protein